MSVKSSGSAGEALPSSGGILRTAVLKKMKTSRKKYFVLRAETPDCLARLEYYDSEKKFRSGLPPKRSIPLKTCFNINKRTDTKHKHVIALYTKDDCFCIVLDSEEDLQSWLKDLLTLQHGEEMPPGQILKPKFEYVWQIQLCARGLGYGRTGPYRLCLTDKMLTLVRLDGPSELIELNLASVRSCGNLKNFFFLEVGRSSNLGPGELWLEADDSNIAYNMHTTLSHRFKICREQAKAENQYGDPPNGRIRSSSATESNKKNNSNVGKSAIFLQDNSRSTTAETSTAATSTTSVSGVAMTIYNLLQRGSSKRRHSVSGAGNNISGSISHQRTQSLPLATPTTTIAPLPDNATTLTTSHQTRSTSITKRPSQTSKCFRDRCDSMPSRPRTSSEGNHCIPGWGKPYLIPHRGHLRDASHSPPTGSPISPPSDSTGSSYSITDDHDGVAAEVDSQRMHNTLTPDAVIAEEECPDSPHAGAVSGYVTMTPQTVTDGFQHTSHHYDGHNFPSNSASMSSVTSGTPSTDMRFSDYPLDKVFAYVCAEEDDARPCRAYSVGSKPPGVPSPHSATPDNSRMRAFSVGSKTKRYFNRVLPPHHPHPGIKSSSAPILSNSRMANSFGSIGPMGDLMEIDFSSDAMRSRTNTSASGSSDTKPTVEKRSRFPMNLFERSEPVNTTPAGYVEMKPGIDHNAKMNNYKNDVSPYVDMTQGQRVSAYVDMSKGMSPYMDMSGSPFRNATEFHQDLRENSKYSDYVDMEQRHRTNSNPSRNPQTRAALPGYPWESDYMVERAPRRDRNSFNSQMSSSPHFDSVSPQHSDYTPLGFGAQVKITDRPEGYVEMTPGVSLAHQQRQASYNNDMGDYLNMSGVVSSKPAKKERSQPISIQTTSNNQTAKNSSPISITSLLGGKPLPSGTPPRMHLPLYSYTSSPYSSLPRQKSRKNSGSKDSSSSSVTTTPSSSSTMFPLSLNSPNSPASKTNTPTIYKVPPSILNIAHKVGKTADYAIMDMDGAKPAAAVAKSDDISDYVNYCPGPPAAPKTPILQKCVDDSAGDYAIMKPGKITEGQRSMTLPRMRGPKSGIASPLAAHLSHVGLNEHSEGFRPITEKDERMSSPKPADQVPSKLTQDDKPLEAANMEVEDSPYETLQASVSFISQPIKSSIPSSSNPERIQPCTAATSSDERVSRPASVCSEASTIVFRNESSNCEQQPLEQTTRLHYASLDLTVTDEDGTKSSRVLKNSLSEVNLSQGEPTFVYADIDFIKSEDLKNSGANACGSIAANVSSSATVKP
ncbi:insulin receptor substrate 2-B isoform X2 [Cylas formicarius]|uniref:insulin receptor substrate 2-B isoform X2 n=1 Tax=Cylas formicarius TaxID=197179 RepID=UPI0029584553|nr:insulin receptor substrate 2-B isoform X2 [Cylas formicarius]